MRIETNFVEQDSNSSSNPDQGDDDDDELFSSAELLDEMTTNRGEFKRRPLSFSSSSASLNERQHQVFFLFSFFLAPYLLIR